MWGDVMFEEDIDLQATMFQPVGGMDRIPAAFAKKLGPVVAAERGDAIKRRATGQHRLHRQALGQARRRRGGLLPVDHPAQGAAPIDNDFARPRAAIRAVPYGDAIKIAWESPRFWESTSRSMAASPGSKARPRWSGTRAIACFRRKAFCSAAM